VHVVEIQQPKANIFPAMIEEWRRFILRTVLHHSPVMLAPCKHARRVSLPVRNCNRRSEKLLTVMAEHFASVPPPYTLFA
jgi:hypothetical protein